MRHLCQAIRAVHPDSIRRHLDPSVGFALAAKKRLRQHIIESRSRIITDLKELVDEMAEKTKEWKARLPKHVLAAYSHKDAPGGITQIPVMLRLMG